VKTVTEPTSASASSSSASASSSSALASSSSASASALKKELKYQNYSLHETNSNSHPDSPYAGMTYEALEKDYWDMVEIRSRETAVDYGNDLDTLAYYSGFLSYPDYLKQLNIVDILEEDLVPDETHTLPIRSGLTPEGSIRFQHVSPNTLENSFVPPALQSQRQFTNEFYATTAWNLQNLPLYPNSVLRHVQVPITGVNVPWLYVGMLFSTFCWHVEDNFLASINYNHFGDVKHWYGVSSTQARLFEKTAKDFLFELFKESPDLLQHMATQISPSLLRGKELSSLIIIIEMSLSPSLSLSIANGVNVYQVKQEAGTFVITFPNAFHGGFSYGVSSITSNVAWTD
jgi:histone demethylase JARID1